jgi:hypothetical protein
MDKSYLNYSPCIYRFPNPSFPFTIPDKNDELRYHSVSEIYLQRASSIMARRTRQSELESSLSPTLTNESMS